MSEPLEYEPTHGSDRVATWEVSCTFDRSLRIVGVTIGVLLSAALSPAADGNAVRAGVRLL